MLTGHTGEITALAFRTDGLLASGSADRSVRLWNVATRQPVGPPLVAASPVADVAFSPDGAVLAVAGERPAIQLFDVASSRLIAELPAMTVA